MNFNTLSYTPASRSIVNQFGGYNHNLRIGDNEFYDMQNMCFDDYPAISSCAGEYITDTLDDITIWDTLVVKPPVMYHIEEEGEEVERYTDTETAFFLYTDSSQPNDIYLKFYADGDHEILAGPFLRLTENLTVADMTSAKMVKMGAEIIIVLRFKDRTMRLYKFNISENKAESIQLKYTTVGDVSFALSNKDGKDYENLLVYNDELPETGTKGQYAIMKDKSGNYGLYVYSGQYSGWFEEPNAYVKISGGGVGKYLKDNDYIEISGILWGGASVDNTDRPQSRVLRDKFNGAQTIAIANANNDYVLIKGVIPYEEHQSGVYKITFDKKVPAMDYMIEHNNRIWGCRYGENADGEFVNEIYASALGDATNWIAYTTTAISPYAVSLGTDGEFTGAAVFGGYPVFFKENYIHRIYGSYPANYQVITTECRGVQKGSSNSLKSINGLLYYKSPIDMCVYDGTLPISISNAWGQEQRNYTNAIATVVGNEYQVVVKDNNESKMLIYDVFKGIWRKQTAPPCTDAVVNYKGTLYWFTRGKVCELDPTAPINWYIESGILGTEYIDSKCISRMDIRMQIQPESIVTVLIEYDSSGRWQHAGTVTGMDLRTFTFPIKPRRCDHFRIRIEGNGKAKIFSITKSVKGVK